MPLNSAERRALRARAHALKPVVLIGGSGITESLLAEVSRALHDHELIKVRLPALDRDARAVMVSALCTSLGAEDVQGIGHIRVLYRAREEEPAPPQRPASRPARRARPQR